MGLDRYGHFSEDGREFIIARPDTPAPWVNYISNGRYTGLVSNTGGGFSYWMDPRDSRITRIRYNSLPWDRPGRYVYIRDKDGEYWSASWQPTGHKPDFYECRVGMGYQKIEMLHRGVRSEITYFVPLDDDLEIWLVKLRNESSEPKHLTCTSYVELCLGHALVDLINQPNDQHFNIASFDREDNAIYATKNYWVTHRAASVKQPNQGWDRCVFFTTDTQVQSWDCLKDAFVGNWRSEAHPVGVEQGRLSNTDITAGDACAALQSEMVIDAGEDLEFVVLLGCVGADCRQEKAKELIRRYRSPDSARAELQRIKTYWDQYLSAAVAETPDPQMDLMVNVWGKRQTWVTFNANRNAGYYHGGILYGIGIRDLCQDMMGPLVSDAKAVKQRLCEVLCHQFQDGSTLHNFFRLTGQGEKTGHSDTPLWLPMAVINCIKETGEIDFLSEVIGFQDSGEADVLDHILRAIDYTLSDLTDNHLPRFGPGDWNDTLDYVGRDGRGESVWVAEFLCFILKQTIELLDYVSGITPCRSASCLKEKAEAYRDEYGRIAEGINKLCWDGAWYIRGTRDDGGVIGSSKNSEGRIFMNAQSWAVISGVAGPDRARTALDSADELLITSRGPKILSPSYTQLDEGIGLATRCVPGKKENGAIFNHVAAWAIMANALAGNGNRAYSYYRRTLPMVQAHNPDVYKMEPYVYSEYVTSDDHPTFGQASHSWLTGSAVCMFRDGLDYILGVRPTYEGLIIDPCIPDDWDGFKVTRRFRSAVYEIEVRNPNHVQHGVDRIEVDGTTVNGKLIPAVTQGRRVSVLCVMG